MKSRACLALLALGAIAHAEETRVLPLSGMGEKGEAPVYWDFRLDTGRGSGAWRRIVVPSCWEQRGFGSYYYGTQGRGKPDDDPIIPKETGTYRRRFELPASWAAHEIHVVFEAAMTDTTVEINGRSAGPTHQGGFYRFDYDITPLVKPGRNEILVRVAKESSNTSVNRAERRGDFWTFGGIYRPVWLEARPIDNIAWTAIDARADGSFRGEVHLNHAAPGASVQVQLFDAMGKPFESALEAAVEGGIAHVKGHFAGPAMWNAETPNLYSARFTLMRGSRELHVRRERFGFRTLEVRENDGVYLNGRKIVLKGVNRHSFEPETARTLTRAQNFDDARLIRAANMNAVRMSHYPPDPAFLEAADELGLYVLDELAGWQGSYDTPTGARLIGETVRRDLDHPSILFWDNGNEGGWNEANDGEFARWDVQARPVLHPWEIHDGIDTNHYENYDSTASLSRGPRIFMPTEFLHGLYDGGIGAGFHDYWDVMGSSPTVAGGFFWSFVDEGIARSDQHGRIDNMGNAAPDGMMGPHREKEGSYFTVREIWSPVVVRDLRFSEGRLEFRAENHYDFTDLAACAFRWRVRRLPAAGASNERMLAEGRTRAPTLAPRGATDVRLSLPLRTLGADDIVELSVIDPRGEELWTWVLRGAASAPHNASIDHANARVTGSTVRAGDFALDFDRDSGELRRLSQGALSVPLAGPRFAAWLRQRKTRGFDEVAGAPRLVSLELAPADGSGVLAHARYDGNLRDVTWRLREGAIVMSYEFDFTGAADILGVHFDFPERDVTGKRWVGAGPYRIWNNRRQGTRFGVHEARYSRGVPGVSYHYPEFEGFFGEWSWLEMRTREADVIVRNSGDVPFFGLYAPSPGEKPILEAPDLGWSFLHAIPSIGTKFAPADVLGPQSQPGKFDGVVRGEIAISLAPPGS